MGWGRTGAQPKYWQENILQAIAMRLRKHSRGEASS